MLFFIYSEIFILILAFFSSIISICFFLFFIFLLKFSVFPPCYKTVYNCSLKCLYMAALQSLSDDTDSWYTFRLKVKVKVTQSCPTLYNPMDYMVHGILQARMLERVAFPFSRGSSQPRDRTQVSSIADRFFTSWDTREAQEYWSGRSFPSPADLPDPWIQQRSPALLADSLPIELSRKPYTFRY